MTQRRKPCHRFQVTSAIAIVTICSLLVQPLEAYTPNSKEVQQICEKAVRLLQQMPDTDKCGGSLGGECLVSLAIHKYYKTQGKQFLNNLDPRVQSTLKRCRDNSRYLRFDDLREAERRNRDNPNVVPDVILGDEFLMGAVLVFLSEVSPVDDFRTIQDVSIEVLRAQRPNGSWQLGGRDNIFATQFAVLGLWSAANLGIDVRAAPMEHCANYLVRVQDLKSGWGFSPNDPGKGIPPRLQPGVSTSPTWAALGSLSLLADYLGLKKSFEPEDNEKLRNWTDRSGQFNRKAKFKKVQGGEVFLQLENKKIISLKKKLLSDTDQFYVKDRYPPIRYKSNMPFAPMKKAMNDGAAFTENNRTVHSWVHSYFFSQELLNSLRESAEGKIANEPLWYNYGVRLSCQGTTTSRLVWSIR